MGMEVALLPGVTCWGSGGPTGAGLEGWARVFGRLDCLGDLSACFLVRCLLPGEPPLGNPLFLEELGVLLLDDCDLSEAWARSATGGACDGGDLSAESTGDLDCPWVKPNWSKDLGIVRAWCWCGASWSSA